MISRARAEKSKINKGKVKKDIDKSNKIGYNNGADLKNGNPQVWRSTQVGRRGAPAKGVGRIYPAREFKSLLLRHKKAIKKISPQKALIFQGFFAF